jgi:hypothetical protein
MWMIVSNTYATMQAPATPTIDDSRMGFQNAIESRE